MGQTQTKGQPSHLSPQLCLSHSAQIVPVTVLWWGPVWDLSIGGYDFSRRRDTSGSKPTSFTPVFKGQGNTAGRQLGFLYLEFTGLQSNILLSYFQNAVTLTQKRQLSREREMRKISFYCTAPHEKTAVVCPRCLDLSSVLAGLIQSYTYVNFLDAFYNL